MPTVEIKRSSADLPLSTNLPNAPRVSADPYAGSGFAGIGEALDKVVEQHKAAEDATYVANTTVAVQQQVDELRKQRQKEFAENPKGYSKALFEDANSVYQDAISKAPSADAKRALQYQLAGFARSDFAQASAWEQQATVSNYLTQHEKSVNSLTNRLFDNPAAAAQVEAEHAALMASARTFLSPEEYNKLSERDGKQLASATIYGTMEKNPGAASHLLASGEYDDVFDGIERERFAEQIHRKQKQIESEVEAARNKQRELVTGQALLDIHNIRNLDDVNAVQQHLDSMLKDEIIKPREYVALSDHLESSSKKMIQVQGGIARVSSALDNGLSLSPHNENDQKAVDSYYTNVFGDTLDPQNPQDAINKTVAFVTKVGVVPSQLKADIEAGLNGGSPGRQTRAADFMMQFVNQSPRLAREFNETDMAYARKITDLRSAGLTSEQAVESAKIEVYEKESAPYKVRSAQFNKDAKTFNASEVGQFFRNDPSDIPDAMKADWQELYRSFYVDQQLSESSARELAYQRLQTQWGVSSLTGEPRWVRNAPELVYGVPNIDSDWMKEDLKSTVGDKAPLNKVVLIQNPATYASKQPNYFVMYTDDEGLIRAVPSSANPKEPLRWKPSWSDSPEFKKVNADEQARIKDLEEAAPKARKAAAIANELDGLE